MVRLLFMPGASRLLSVRSPAHLVSCISVLFSIKQSHRAISSRSAGYRLLPVLDSAFLRTLPSLTRRIHSRTLTRSAK